MFAAIKRWFRARPGAVVASPATRPFEIPGIVAPPAFETILTEAIGDTATSLTRDAWVGLVGEIGDRPEWIPTIPTTFPMIATRMLEMLRDPDLDLNRLVGVVQRDAGIAASLLKVANSAAYAPHTPVTSLRTAITMLGARRVSEIALFTASRSMYDVPSHSDVALFPNLWPTMFNDAIANAFTAGRLALDLANTSSERALIVGLLADVGRPAALRIVTRLVREGYSKPDDEIVAAAVDEVAPAIGNVVVSRMGLPPELHAACTTATCNEAMIGRLIASIGAVQRKTPRVWACASEIRHTATSLGLSPFQMRMQFSQRTQYYEQAATLFG